MKRIETRIDLTDTIYLCYDDNSSYKLIYEDDNDHMMTITGYADNDFNKISWIKPNGYDYLVVGESLINGKKITKIIQDSEGNYILFT